MGGKAPCEFMELEQMFSHFMLTYVTDVMSRSEDFVWQRKGNVITFLNSAVPSKVICSYLGREWI